MGRKPLVNWSSYKKYYSFFCMTYESYRKQYLSAYRAKRFPKGTSLGFGYILTLDCNTVTGATKHAQYCRKVREGKI